MQEVSRVGGGTVGAEANVRYLQQNKDKLSLKQTLELAALEFLLKQRKANEE